MATSIYNSLVSEFETHGRDEGVMPRLVSEVREGANSLVLDGPLAIALDRIIDEFIDNPETLFSMLISSEYFVSQVDKRQFGSKIRRVVNKLVIEFPSQLERFRDGEDEPDPLVRGGALELAQALGIRLTPSFLMKEKSLRKSSRALWLDIFRDEVDSETTKQEYFNAIEEGLLNVDDLTFQCRALRRDLGADFVSQLFGAKQKWLKTRNKISEAISLQNSADEYEVIIHDFDLDSQIADNAPQTKRNNLMVPPTLAFLVKQAANNDEWPPVKGQRAAEVD